MLTGFTSSQHPAEIHHVADGFDVVLHLVGQQHDQPIVADIDEIQPLS
jgi:hypothetical protein